MYTDYLLKFADEAEATAVLFDGQTAKYSAIDVIGVIRRPTGDTLVGSDGPIQVMEPVPGWHVNVRHAGQAPELDAYKVDPTPATPERVWL